MSNVYNVKHEIIKKSLEFAKYSILPDKDKTEDKEQVDDKNHMLEHLYNMFAESKKKHLELANKKEDVIKYLKRRDVFFELTDGFSIAILYYTVVNIVNTFFASTITALHMGLIFATLIHPAVAIAVFLTIALALYIKYKNKSDEEKHPAIFKLEDDLEELQEEINDLEKHVSFLREELSKSKEIFSKNLLHNTNVASQNTKANLSVEFTTFFLIGNTTSSVGLAASTLSASQLNIPTHLSNIINHISGMNILSKDFVSFHGLNPFYFLAFFSLYIPMKIYDYKKYGKHHKNIREEILNTKVNMQQIDFIIKLNESLSILNKIQTKASENKTNSEHLKTITEELKSEINTQKDSHKNSLDKNLQYSIFKQISADYSKLGKLESVSTFFYLLGNKIKQYFISSDYIATIQNLSKTISEKVSTLNAINAINAIKPQPIDDIDFSRKENINFLPTERLNKRIAKISKNAHENINDFIKEFTALANNNYDNLFENLDNHNIGTHKALLTYFNYINNSKLKELYEIVKNKKPNDVQNISNYIPEILHIVEQELNLTLAYKTSKVIEHRFNNFICNNSNNNKIEDKPNYKSTSILNN